ncbi:MAG: hypothetical protein JNN08_27815 [Bryobacterales bacterium]|nr:hypothetical protein [Bryobacterales bacterium]
MKRRDRKATMPEGVAEPSTVTQPDPAAEPRDDPDSQHRLWNRLAARVRAGDPTATVDFSSAYRRGIRLLFRRYLGPIGIEGLVDEAMAGAVEELRRGWIAEPRDLVHFVRGVIARHQGTRRLEPVGPTVQGVSEKLHMRKQAALIETALRHFSARDRQVLESYYLKGEPLAAALESAGMTETDFERLKSRLCRATSPRSEPVNLRLVRVQTAGTS